MHKKSIFSGVSLHYCIHKNLQLDSILTNVNSDHKVTYCLGIGFIILVSTPRFSYNWSIPSGFPN